ncbi:proline iminopeptidase [Microlunatus panaciterrae]|uniref:Proline iminopeptidase n=1 Tax=Microlunatus panaciterrae TaxID=400768 RepID=A0ABS2RDL8_9ACTN|nr:alpha/beta hydrolase [Microlunatus panaciterrae]MBM7797090.1 proline iminopeptidase [Microlunatus panaciterrae]
MTVPADDGVPLHVGMTGTGPAVVVLSGGPGCVHYLEDDALAPRGARAFYPEPRGVGRSGGGPHDLRRAVDDLEAVRKINNIQRWVVLGHSWGSDLGIRYALDRPDHVQAVVGVAGHGLHKDRTWSQVYEAAKHTEADIVIDWSPDVHASLNESFSQWIHEKSLLRRLADTTIPMHLIAADEDIRPSWPLEQLAALVPDGRFSRVPGVPHNFWATHPRTWVEVVSEACSDYA